MRIRQRTRKRLPGAGRPKLPPGQLKLKQAYVALTQAEKDRYELEARSENLTLSYYLRKCLDLPIDGAIRRRPVSEESQAV